MNKSFTHYWTGESLTSNEEGSLCRHAAGNAFSNKGVSVGDRIFVVNVYRGEMYLVARFTVGEIVFSDEEVRQRLDYEPWPAKEHLIAVEGTASPIRMSRVVPIELTKALEFHAPDGQVKGLKFVDEGALDSQTLRGVRRLTEASARLLDGFLERTPDGTGQSLGEDSGEETIFHEGSEANHEALKQLAELLRDMGFSVRKKSRNESTLRVYIDAQSAYPLLNPRFVLSDEPAGFLEVTILSKGPSEQIDAALGSFQPTPECQLFHASKIAQGYRLHGAFVIAVGNTTAVGLAEAALAKIGDVMKAVRSLFVKARPDSTGQTCRSKSPRSS